MKSDERQGDRANHEEEGHQQQGQGEQHHHDPVARPKIPKNKLPSVFNPSRKKKQDRPIDEPQDQQNENKRSSTDKPERKQPDLGKKPVEHRRSKKSMNPLIPARNQIKLFDKLDEEIMEARQDFQRFARMNIDKLSAQPVQLRLDHSVTLAVVEQQTSRGGLLKKVLNVPTFKIFYLEQVPISGRDSPNMVRERLEQWDAIPSNGFQLRTQGMFWNYPQGSMSLIYDYVDTIALTSLMETLGYLPQNLIRQVLTDCISGVAFLDKQGVAFPNFSWRDIHLSVATGKLQFRPQIDLNCHSQIKSQKGELLNELLAQQPVRTDRQKTLVYRIGFLLLYASLGTFVFDEQLNQAIRTVCRNATQKSAGRKADSKVSSGNCCIMHLLDTLSGINNNHPQLALDLPLYRSAKRRLSASLQDLICGCLRQNQSNRFRLDDLLIHKFVLHSDQPGKFDLKDTFSIAKAERGREPDHKKQGESQVVNLLQSIDLVLANCNGFDLPSITEENRVVQDMAEELLVDPVLLNRKLNQLYGHYRR